MTVTISEIVVDLLLLGEDELAEEMILTENQEEHIVRSLQGDTTLMNYMMKFHEYLEDHDIYLFDGWEDAEFVGKPIVEKFWATFYVLVPKGTDLRGAMRIKNDKEAQNSVMTKELSDGSMIVKFKVLKRYLDAIEQRTQDKTDELSDDEVQKFS